MKGTQVKTCSCIGCRKWANVRKTGQMSSRNHVRRLAARKLRHRIKNHIRKERYELIEEAISTGYIF